MNLIVAVNEKWGIGKDGGLLAHLPEDMKYFRETTSLIFYLDGVGLAELRNLYLRFGGDPERVRRLPMPTFLVLSGTCLLYTSRCV